VFGTDYATPDGTCIRDYVHVVDIARLTCSRSGASTRWAWRSTTSAASAATPVLEVIAARRAVLGRKVPWRAGGAPAGDPAVLVASAGRVSEDLGWAPADPGLDPIVESAWRWRKRHPRGYAG